MGFFGLGRRSTTNQPTRAPTAQAGSPPPVRTGLEKTTLAETAVRGTNPAARTAALDALLKDADANAAQLAIVAIQDAEGAFGVRAIAAVSERRLLKDAARKAKHASVREAATKRIADIEVAATKPSEERARQTRAAALEPLVPRATKLAVSSGVGAEAAWVAICAERDAVLGQHAGLALDARAQAVIDRLSALEAEIRARIAEAAVKAEANARAQADQETAQRSAQQQREAEQAAGVARRTAPAPQGLADIVARAEELAQSKDPDSVADELLRLHKDWMGLSADLDPQHEMRVRFLRAWDVNREARKRARADQGERRALALANLSELVSEAESLATAADSIAPDDAATLSAHQAALDTLRIRFRDATRAVLPAEGRAARERFQAALDDAYAPLRAAREAADAESFANLVRAEQLKDEIEALPVDSDPAGAFRGLKDIQARWRKLGPLPRIKARVAWDAFKAAGDACFARIKPWLEAQDREREAAIERREQLCMEAEQVLARPTVGLAGSPAERDGRRAASQRMQELQRAWREAGDVPRAMDRGLWSRFKDAQDRFWERHKADLDAEQERRDAFIADCEHLVARAEAFAADAEKAMAAKTGILTAADVQRRVRELRDSAADLPPPPREVRPALEARFDAAIDRILATIRGKLDAEKAQLETAATKRKALLTELEEILSSDNPRWQADAVDKLRTAWRDTGRVPAADREALDKRFAELMGKWRSLSSAAQQAG
ncbi:MAG: DUF349 domain-containing protein [Planctomycetota bacterium]